jgi:hypothetical protein
MYVCEEHSKGDLQRNAAKTERSLLLKSVEL